MRKRSVLEDIGASRPLGGNALFVSMLWIDNNLNYDLAPKASRPVHVVRTIYAEADGEPLPEPVPANVEKREFAWMTVHEYRRDRPVTYPFKDILSLEMVDRGEAASE